MRRLLLTALLVGAAAPALADVSLPPAPLTMISNATPRQLSDAERTAYRQVFQLLAAADYKGAGALLDALPGGVLTPYARAELMLRDPGARDPVSLSALLTGTPELPQAAALAKLGGIAVPLPLQHALVRSAGPSKRAATRPTRDAATWMVRLQPLLKSGDVAGAEALVESTAATMPPEALTELRQKLAWAYFQAGDDVSARRVASVAKLGAGDWSVDAAWVDGLAGWRSADVAAAADAFDRVASNAGDAETRAAGLFWAARSKTAAHDDDDATQRLQSASRLDETFYGMLAGAVLGVRGSPAATLDGAGGAALPDRANLRAAAALAEIGETARADQLIRYQARIGPPAEHARLIALAADLALPATQVWLAQNIPAGTRSSLTARYPMPAWSPTSGWRVDPALLYAHALQESELRCDAVSRAGARGLMQLMPTTAQLIARHKGDVVRPLDDPAVSFEYGQSYLEELAVAGGTGGLLPKVIAAYNAGPNNVARWTGGQNDPLLFIESIPFAQTRTYVAIVLRNYWIYQRRTGAATPSMTALAEGRWPMFPARAVQTASTTGGGATTYAPN